MFTSSVESTHRLYLLLAALSCLPERVVEYSSLVRPEERAQHLEAFRSGAAKVGGAGVGWACQCCAVCEVVWGGELGSRLILHASRAPILGHFGTNAACTPPSLPHVLPLPLTSSTPCPLHRHLAPAPRRCWCARMP